jgi:hypothetical protein
VGDATGQAVRVTYGDVFRVREFRALWLAQLLSVAGDQLARVALTLLVYRQTNSALLAAITFVMGLLPVFLGGVFLSGLADRLPRRAVMIGCDLARLVLVLAMTLPGVPLAGLVALLFAVSTLSAPFTAARAATYPEILHGESYMVGTAVTLTTIQLAQVVGYGVSGLIVSLFNVRTSLVIDAATFGASAILIRLWVLARPAAGQPEGERRPSAVSGMLAGFRLVFGNPALRTPMLFGWLAALYDSPEGIATPFAKMLGHEAITVGLLLAAPAFGNTVGCLVFGRLVSPQLRPPRGGCPGRADPDRLAPGPAGDARYPGPVRCLRLLPGGSECRVCRGSARTTAQPGIRACRRRHEPGPGHCPDPGRRCRPVLRAR